MGGQGGHVPGVGEALVGLDHGAEQVVLPGSGLAEGHRHLGKVVDPVASRGGSILTKTFHFSSRGRFLKTIPIGVPTYAGMKTGFHADVSPKNWFSCRHRSEC